MSEYRQDPRINASKLKEFLDQDPRIAHHKLANPTPPSPATSLGAAVHAIIEHLGELPNDLVEFPFDSLRTKESKKWMKANSDKTVLKSAEIQQAKAMAQNVLDTDHCGMREIIHHPESQREVAFYDDQFKALLDIVSPSGKIDVDYKTTSATSAEAFMRSAISYGYALQAYHYKMMSKCSEFYFVAVSSVAPYPVWVIECSPSFLAFGESQWHRAMTAMSSEAPHSYEMDAPKWWTETPISGEDLSTFY